MEVFKTLFYQYKGGKGVTAPPSAKGIKRFLFICYTHFWRLIGMNLLFILFCLPVVTIPPAITALNRVLLNLVREGNTFFFRDFIDEFKSSFLKSWIAFIPWLIAVAISVMGNEILVHANIGKDVVIIRMASSLLDVANMDYIKKNIEVNVSFSKERIHLFDKETECTLA